MKDYLNSKDINYNLYAVYIIKNFMIENEANNTKLEFLVSQLNIEYLLLLTSLFNKDNKKLSFDILYILINIAFCDKGAEIFGLEEKIIFNIGVFLGKNKNDSNLLYHGIWLIKNMSFKNDKICEILLKYKIIDFFDEIYERHLLEIDFMKNLMSCISDFINYKLNMKKKGNNNSPLCLLPSINIIKTQLRPNISPELLNKFFYSLYNLTFFNSLDIYLKMTSNKIHKELMNIYPIIIGKIDELNSEIKEYKSNNNQMNNNKKEEEKYEKNIKNLENYKSIILLILKILGKIMSLDDAILTQTLIDSGIANFYNYVLQSNDVRIIKNASFGISNICAGTYGQLACLYESNTFVELIKVSKNIYEALDYNSKLNNVYYSELKDAFREINFVFSLAIINSVFEKSIPLVKYNNCIVVLFLIKALNILNENGMEQLMEYILSALYKLIVFDRGEKKKNNENNKDNNNNLDIVEFMEINGIKEYLEKLKSNKNEKVVGKAEIIYNAIFYNFEIDDDL